MNPQEIRPRPRGRRLGLATWRARPDAQEHPPSRDPVAPSTSAERFASGPCHRWPSLEGHARGPTDADLSASGLAGNRSSDRLPKATRRKLLPLLRPVELVSGQVLYEDRGPVEHTYFPAGAALSALKVMRGGTLVEAGDPLRDLLPPTTPRSWPRCSSRPPATACTGSSSGAAVGCSWPAIAWAPTTCG